MIELKANIKGISFKLFINGTEVIYEDYTGKKTQWFPPKSKDVFANLDPEEYVQWKNCKTEEEVYRLIKMDLIKNGCADIKEKRIIENAKL